MCSEGGQTLTLEDWLCELVQGMKGLEHDPKANTSGTGIGAGQEQPRSEWGPRSALV